MAGARWGEKGKNAWDVFEEGTMLGEHEGQKGEDP